MIFNKMGKKVDGKTGIAEFLYPSLNRIIGLFKNDWSTFYYKTLKEDSMRWGIILWDYCRLWKNKWKKSSFSDWAAVQ